MTPKFDSLASLLMEMPRGDHNRIPDKTRKEIAEYIEEFPKDTYQEIADAFGVSVATVKRIAKELEIGRGRGFINNPQSRMDWAAAGAAWTRMQKGKETHHKRKLSDDQEKEVLDHWMANHNDMTFSELARWVKQQFNVVMSRKSLAPLLKRVAAKQKPPVQLPTLPRGPKPMRRIASKHRNEPGSGKLPTQSSHHFNDTEPGIVPSNPKHGGPAHPPK